jgi:hypothetical protein
MNDVAKTQPDKVHELAELWQECENQFQQQAGPVEAPNDAEGR